MDDKLLLAIKDAEIKELKKINNGLINSDNNFLSYQELKNYYDNYHNFFSYIDKLRRSNIYRGLRKIKNGLKKKEINISSAEKPIIKKSNSKRKKVKILLVVDIKGWCFWNIAQEIKKYLQEYEITILPLEEIDNNLVKLFFYAQDYDLIHFFWRGHLSFFKSQESYMNECGLSYDNFMNNYVYNKNITTSVYDHLYLDDLEFTNSMLNIAKNYVVSSNILKNIYDKEEKILKKPQMVITDGVDLNLFKMTAKRDFNKEKLVIGWVGNSLWQNGQDDIKGFNTILKPMLDELIKEGYPIECYFADKQERMIAHEDMPEYYQKIDICLCASLNEGTPNPVLEAMAMGAVVITTDVGIVKDALGSKQKKFIVKRDKESFKEKIIELINNRSLLEELSKENMRQIQKWDWPKIMQNFKKFFEENID